MSGSSIPALVVGGYLGAGKTTLINGFLRAPGGRRATVLVNDFGAVNIDAGLIENASGDTIALTNGCACCAIGDSLLEAAQAAVGGNTPPDRRPDLLIVEASGVARPRRMADMLMGVAGLAPARCLTVVNGARLARNLRDRFVSRLVRSQIDSADLLALNRLDARARQLLDAEFPPARRARAVSSLSEALAAAGPRQPEGGPAQDPAPEFMSRVLRVDAPVALDRLEEWLACLPDGIERVKGVLMVRRASGDIVPMTISWAQGLAEIGPAGPAQAENCGKLVLIAGIGAGLLPQIPPI